MEPKALTELSKFLSFVLRHKPDAVGLEVAQRHRRRPCQLIHYSAIKATSTVPRNIEASLLDAAMVGPLRALMTEVDREGHVDRATPPDLAAVSARWARVSDAIRIAVGARIAHAQAAQSQAPKR